MPVVKRDAARDGERPDTTIMDAMSMSLMPAKDGVQPALDLEQRMELLIRISQLLGSAMELDALLQEILSLLFQAFENADRGVIFIRPPGGGDIDFSSPAAAKVRFDADDDGGRLPVSRTIIGDVVGKGRCVLCANAMSGQDFLAASIMANRIRSLMVVPFLYGKEVYGVICLEGGGGDGPFTQQDLTLLGAMANQMTLSVHIHFKMLERLQLERSQAHLRRYLSPDLAEKVAGGQIPMDMGGQLKEGVFLFADIVGFTRMSERLAPADVVAALNDCYERMVRVIFSRGGSIDKFGGDMVMAHWDIISPAPDAPFAAAQAALLMQRELAACNARQRAAGVPEIGMGIGLNGGTVLAGNIGSTERMEFTVIGDSVNLAARLEALAPRGCVYLSAATFAPLRERALAIGFAPTAFKGKSEPLPVFSLRGLLVDGEWILAIPVRFKTTTGLMEGLLTSLDREGRLRMLAPHAFKPGVEATGRLALPELQGAEVAVRVTVLERARVPTPPGQDLVESVLRPTGGWLETFLASRLVQLDIPASVISRETPSAG